MAYTSFPDPGSGYNPFISGVYHRLQFLVGKNPVRHRITGAQDLSSYTAFIYACYDGSPLTPSNVYGLSTVEVYVVRNFVYNAGDMCLIVFQFWRTYARFPYNVGTCTSKQPRSVVRGPNRDLLFCPYLSSNGFTSRMTSSTISSSLFSSTHSSCLRENPR